MDYNLQMGRQQVTLTLPNGDRYTLWKDEQDFVNIRVVAANMTHTLVVHPVAANAIKIKTYRD